MKKITIQILKIIFLLMLGLTTWRIVDYTKPDNFPIKHVKIVATYEHVKKNELQDIITSYIKNGFFYLNFIGMKKNLSQLPWVRNVYIKRKWPDTLIIKILEQQAVLQWGADSLISKEGDVFTVPKDSFPKNLPIMIGTKEQFETILSNYQKLLIIMKPLDFSIQQIELNSHQVWEILLTNGIMILLKEKDPIKQMEFLVSIYKRVVAGHENLPKSIDLRYSDGLAVKWE